MIFLEAKASAAVLLADLEAWLCLSWVRMALVCGIDQPSQLHSTLPSGDQQEEQQAAGLALSLCTKESPDLSALR